MDLINYALKATIEASKVIMKYYDGDIKVDKKEDNSPVTIADREADKIIREILADSDLPILSEEVAQPPYEERKNWKQFWMVDPLDGTKEFIKKNGEFTINIALFEDGKPIGGVIGAPAADIVYFGQEGYGAYKATLNKTTESVDDILKTVNPLMPENPKEGEEIGIAVSRSHLDDITKEYMEKMKKKVPVNGTSAGSAIKIGLLAEGKAHVYPRFSPCMEWDIAAGFGIVNQLGFEFLDAKTKNPILFNKENLLVNGFIALRDKKYL